MQLDGGTDLQRLSPELTRTRARYDAIDAIKRIAPGQTMAVYAACPELRLVQDFTADRDVLIAATEAFVLPPARRSADKKLTIDSFVPPMLSVLRDVATRMSGASGRKSVVWISQAYGEQLNPQAVQAAADSTIAAFNDANVTLYAVDTRFNPTCENVRTSGNAPRAGEVSIRNPTCTQPPDISDDWMDYLARTTGGRAFSGGKVSVVREYDTDARLSRAQYRLDSDHSLVEDAIHFAVEQSRSAYELGFYVPEPELDGSFHMLKVAVPAKPKFELSYRSGYTASAATDTVSDIAAMKAPPSASTIVGIDASFTRAPRVKNEVEVSLGLTPETVTRSPDGVVIVDATFIQMNDAGKPVSPTQETLRLPAADSKTEMIRFTRAVKLARGAALLRIRISDQATGRVGSVSVPLTSGY
jgi:hypothetical protein